MLAAPTQLSRAALLAAIAIIICPQSVRAVERLVFGDLQELDEPAAMTGGNFSQPNLTASSDVFWLTWVGPRGGSRIDPTDLSVLDPDGLSGDYFGDSSDYLSKLHASNGKTLLVGRETDRFDENEADFGYCITLSDGSTARPTSEVQWLQKPVAAMGAVPGGNYLLVWSEPVELTRKILKGIRVDGTTGLLLDDPAGIVLTEGDINERIAVTGDEAGFVAVYGIRDGEKEMLRSVRISEEGARAVSEDMVIVDDVGFLFDVEAVSGGFGTVALWSGSTPEGGGLFGARLDRSGDTPVSLLHQIDGEQHIFDIAAAAGETDLALLWKEEPTISGDENMRGALIAADGADLVVVEEIFEAVETAWQDAPAVAFYNGTYLAVWQDRRLGGWQVFGARFSENSVQDPDGVALAGAANSERGPRVSKCTEGYLLAWTDDRFSLENGRDVIAARVTVDGEVQGEAVPIIGTTEDEFAVDVAESPAGCTVLAVRSPGEEGIGGSLAVRAVDGETGTPTGNPVEIFEWDTTAGIDAVLAGSAEGMLTAFAIDTRLFIADVTDIEQVEPPEKPLFTADETEPGSYGITDVMAAVVDDTILLTWTVQFAPGPDRVISTPYMQRLRFTDDGIVPTSAPTVPEVGVSLLTVFGDRFLLLRKALDFLEARFVPKDPDGDIVVAETQFAPTHQLISLAAVPFDDRLLMVYQSYLPIDDGTTARAALFGVLLDDKLNVRAGPAELPESSTTGRTLIAEGDRALLFSETRLHDADRLALHTITVTDAPISTDTDTETEPETPGTDTDAPAAVPSHVNRPEISLRKIPVNDVKRRAELCPMWL